MFGGDSTGKDYAPHMWVGEHFIHNTGKTVTVGCYYYYAGKMSNEQLVAERWTNAQTTPTPVPMGEIPEKVRAAFSPTAFADEESGRATIAQMLG